MTNFITDPNGTDATDVRIGDVAEPGRIIGLVSNDIYFERDPKSMWYGEPRPIGGIPVGIYARVDTVPNVNAPYTPDNWRLLTTVYTSSGRHVRGAAAVDRDVQLPDPAGPVPGHVPGEGGRPRYQGGPEPRLRPQPADRDVRLGRLAGPDRPARHAARPDLRYRLRGPGRPGTPGAAAGLDAGCTCDGQPPDHHPGDFIGTAGAATGATGVRATLTDDRTGQVQTLTRANGGIVSWTPGNATTPDTIVISVPALASNAVANALPNSSFRPGPKQLTITTANANGGVSSVNGITLHVMGSNGTGTNALPTTRRWSTSPAPTITGANAHALQTAIDGAAAGSLLVLSAGVYNENVVVWKPLKIQGLGPGGIIGAHELQARDPEDPRFHVLGSVIDGRYFAENAAGLRRDRRGTWAVRRRRRDHPVLRGADLTDARPDPPARTTSAAASSATFAQARVDGIALMTGQGEGAGGIQLQAYANNTQLTNNVLENNAGLFAGGIGIGAPYSDTNPAGASNHVGAHNYNVKVANDRMIGNGGLTRSGGLGIFYGSNAYEVANSIVCANFGVEYGAGISHWGLSPGGKIHDNQIYYNDAVDSGAGISIQSQLPVGGGSLGDGSGTVDVDRNLLAGNYSGDDGGGIFVLDAVDQRHQHPEQHHRRQRRGRPRRRDHARRLVEGGDRQQHRRQQRLDRLVGELRRRPARRGPGIGGQRPRCGRTIRATWPSTRTRPPARTSPTRWRCSTTSSGTTTRTP